LSVGAYKALTPEQKAVASEAVSFKKGQPTLTMIPPKSV
jgi:hypothetical protein